MKFRVKISDQAQMQQEKRLIHQIIEERQIKSISMNYKAEIKERASAKST